MINTTMNQPPTYIGRTAKIASNLWKQIPKLKTVKDPLERRYLFTGEPGLGKSDLAERMAAALTGESFDRVHDRMAVDVEIVNGQSCSVEIVRKWTEMSHYRPMYSPCRVQIVDEVDAMGAAALNEIRTYLDVLPSGIVFLATTNKATEELQQQLQSRFKVCYFHKVSAPEIHAWLISEYGLPDDYARKAAEGANGNVRAAKIDALAWKEINE